MKDHGLSIVRACRLLRLSRTAWYRRPGSRMERDRDVIGVLNEIVGRKPRWGFWKLHDRLRLEGPLYQPQTAAPGVLRNGPQST